MRRDYAGPADLPAIQHFAQRIWTLHSRWHVGGLTWTLGQTPQRRPDRPMALWEAGGEVVAWGWLSPPDGLALLVDPAHPQLVDEVLDWAGDLAGVPLTVTVMDTEKVLVGALDRRGYVADLDGHYFLAHSRDLSDLPPVPDAPDGLVIRPVRRDEADLTRHAAVHREVWPRSTTSDEQFLTMTRGWPYDPGFDVVAEAPDGAFVAYCLGWYDEVNRVGELEPVGTVAGYRRQGLSRAVSLRALHAFREAGGERAIVVSRGDDDYPIAKQVYAALGFTPHTRTVRYRRPHGTA